MTSFLNKLKGNRTRIFGALIAILGVVETNAQVVPDEYRGYLLMATGIAAIILRQFTNTPAGKKEA